MKHYKLTLCILLSLVFCIVSLVGCSTSNTDGEAESTSDATVEESTGEQSTGDTTFYYSNGIDENGFWEGITALDHVELFDYNAVVIPADTHGISDEAVQNEIDALLSYYTTSEQVTDRAVEDGDTVNIDYVGSVDGVEFEGGTTGGAGTDVTIGETNYIDDFIDQLIGHMPGETFDIEVTFPEDYGKEELDGKDAVFVTTINYIALTVESELTDDFVSENFSVDYGWTTIDEMKAGIASDLQEDAITNYLQDYLASEAPIESLPSTLMEYQENAAVDYYESSAASSGMELDEFLSTYMGVSTMDELVESEHDYHMQEATYSLVIQAIAEDAGITVSDEDVITYFQEYIGTDDYSQYEEQYGMPYLKQVVLSQMVLDYVIEHATMA